MNAPTSVFVILAIEVFTREVLFSDLKTEIDFCQHVADGGRPPKPQGAEKLGLLQRCGTSLRNVSCRTPKSG